jgi:hypothetical protein
VEVRGGEQATRRASTNREAPARKKRPTQAPNVAGAVVGIQFGNHNILFPTLSRISGGNQSRTIPTGWRMVPSSPWCHCPCQMRRCPSLVRSALDSHTVSAVKLTHPLEQRHGRSLVMKE